MPTRVEKDFSGLTQFSGIWRSRIARAINSANESVHSLAQQLAPVSEDGSHGHPPGYLQENIIITKEATPNSLSAVTESGAPYTKFVENGTVEHGDAQPFMSPALEAGKQQLREEIRSMGGSRNPPGALKTNV